MKRDLRFSRRNLLKSIGAGAALLPLLESDRADAQCVAGGIKRLYVLVWPNGMLSSINSWATAGNDPSSWTLPPFMNSLQPYQSDLLLLNGVDYKFIKDMPGTGERTGHATYPGLLTGAFYMPLASTSTDVAGCASVDQYIGSSLKPAGGLVSLNQGAFVQSTARISWTAAAQPVLPDLNPYHVFTTYIQGNITTPPPANSGPGPAPPVDAGAPPVDFTKVNRKSVLDYVLSDLNRFRSVVGTADKAAIDSHLTYVRNIENTLTMVAGVSRPSDDGGTITMGSGSACAIPAAATAAPVDYRLSANIPVVAKLHMDLAVLAFAADLTRVAVMQIGDQGAAELILSWPPCNYSLGGANPGDANTGDVNGFHAIAHRNVADKVVCDTWFQTQVAYIIQQMKSVGDMAGGSMLDSSVVLAMNNMRTGTHETTGVPVIMAGSCGGYFKTGRSLALPAGTPNNGILVALCNAFGVPAMGGGTYYGEAMYGGELAVLKG